MNETDYYFNKMKWFSVKKLPYYFSRIGLYRRRHSFFKLNNYLKNEGVEYASLVASGFTFIYNISDITVPLEMFEEKKAFASDEVDIFFSLIKKYYGDILDESYMFLDIGANIGTTSVYVSKKYNKEIISFEPSKDNHKLLCINCLLNGCTGISIENLAVSDTEKELIMEINETNRGNNHVVDQKYDKSDGNHEIIKAVSVDDYLKEKSIPFSKIGFLWMDVEGHEPYALLGMKELLADHRIPLYMEFWNDRIDNEGFEVIYEALKRKYDGFCVVTDNSKAIHEYKIEDLVELYRGDVLRCNLFFW